VSIQIELEKKKSIEKNASQVSHKSTVNQPMRVATQNPTF